MEKVDLKEVALNVTELRTAGRESINNQKLTSAEPKSTLPLSWN